MKFFFIIAAAIIIAGTANYFGFIEIPYLDLPVKEDSQEGVKVNKGRDNMRKAIEEAEEMERR